MHTLLCVSGIYDNRHSAFAPCRRCISGSVILDGVKCG